MYNSFEKIVHEVKMERESKHQRFIRIAEARTNRVLYLLKLLGNCSSTANYEYTKDEVTKIFDVLERELKITKSRFLGIEEKGGRFTLK